MGVPLLHETIRDGSQKRRIWAICDRLHAERGHIPSGREVVDIYVAEGGNKGTGFTQFSHWKKALDEVRPDAPQAAEPGFVDPIPLEIDGQGRLIVPPEMRAAMLLGADGRITARVEGGELRVIAPRVAIRRAQEIARKYTKPGVNIVDEFLAERRAMWGEE
jgi:hypothetical protein